MRYKIAAALLLLAGGALPAAARAQDDGLFRSEPPSRYAQDGGYDDDRDYRDDGFGDRDGSRAQRGMGVRVYLDNQRDLFRPGEFSRVYVRPTEDAFVAVVHITPDGDVDFLWPNDVYDDGYMRGGTSYSVTSRGGVRGIRVGSGYGVGYVMAVASDEPLDLRRVRDFYYRRTSSWDPAYNVVGDPFRAMERIARMLVPDFEDGYGAVDWYTYHVGSQRYRYPRYACYDGYGPWYSSRSPYYDGCDRVRVLLVSVPYYYDTRYYRGDRYRYWRTWYPNDRYVYTRRDPQHGYKERGSYGYDRATGAPNRRPFVRSGDAPPPRTRSAGYDGRGSDGRNDGPPQEGTGSRTPTRQRPTLERRPAETEPVRVSGREREREPEPRGRSGGETRSEPRERRVEPRAEPRRESPSPRSSEPRTSPRSEPRSEPRSAPRDGGGGGGRSAPSERPRVVAPPQG
jgi:hypothetical protein